MRRGPLFQPLSVCYFCLCFKWYLIMNSAYCQQPPCRYLDDQFATHAHMIDHCFCDPQGSAQHLAGGGRTANQAGFAQTEARFRMQQLAIEEAARRPGPGGLEFTVNVRRAPSCSGCGEAWKLGADVGYEEQEAIGG